jgi:hypothetical protein
MLAFVGCAAVGLCVPTGCVVSTNGPLPTRHAIENFFCSRCGCEYAGEPSCGAPSDCPNCGPEFDAATCPPTHCHKKPWHHLPKCKLYDPEAGIFNFCMPPACIHPPPPLPPGRFFPVPVQPAFAPHPYSLLGQGAGAGGAYGANGAGDPPYPTQQCN